MRCHLLPLPSTVLAAVAAAVLATAVVAAPAEAHTRLVSSTPSAGASVTAPAEVVLVFNDPVQPGLSALSVTGPDGEEHAAGTPAAGGDGTSLTQALQGPLDPGAYRVAYRVLAADGHPITGELAFAAAAPAPTPVAPAVTPTAVTPTPAPSGTTGPVRPAASESDEGGGVPVLPLAAGGLVVAGAAGLLARRLGGAQHEA